MNFNNYIEQHRAIEAEIQAIQSLINTGDLLQNAGDIALHISKLAGKIKIHLAMEDNYLYPELQRCDNEQVKKLATDYQIEMGDLSKKFVAYKDKYNTKLRIEQHYLSIKQETTQILQAVEKRIQREELELYNCL